MPAGVGSATGGGCPERRGSTSSEGSNASASHTRSLSNDSSEYMPAVRTRITKTAPPKPAANPLQFIKVGPCELYRSAQEQLRRAEEVKKTKELKKEDQEDWQSNLDNWKSSRRKRVEHIIERCVEVKRLSEEEHERSRRPSKTFSEMMEERVNRRNGRLNLPVYSEEDGNDLSDLGIGTSSASGKSSLSEDCDNHSLASEPMDLDKNHSDLDNMSNCDAGIGKLGSSANEYDTCTTATISSPEPEEYTYEGAIQNYKSRVISRTQSSDVLTPKINGTSDKPKEKSPEKFTNGVRRTSIGNKIESKLSSFEPRRASSVDLNGTETNNKTPLPKVDILKRRELFEKESSPEMNGKITAKKATDLANTKTIKERLSHLEKLTEDSVVAPKSTGLISSEVSSIKDRLTHLEKSTSPEIEKVHLKLSNGALNKAASVKDRLASLKVQTSQEKLIVNNMSSPVFKNSKEKLIDLDSDTGKNLINLSPERTFQTKIKTNGFEETYFREDSSIESHQMNDNSSERNSSPESGLYDSKRFHRSLDSLDTDDNLPAEKFERVQSSDDLCGETGTGGETDREDSGIHTGDVSCAVSQDDEPNDHLSMSVLGTSTNSQDTVIHADNFLTDSPSPQPDLDDVSSKEEFFQAVSHASATNEDDPPTVDENTEIFFDREEEDTVKSLEPDNSVLDALDVAFNAIDTDEPKKPKVTEKIMESQPKKEVSEKTEMKTDAAMFCSYTMKTEEVVKPVQEKIRDEKQTARKPVPLYENIEIFYSSNGLPIVANDMIGFPLGPPVTAMEPPKEKPPPPPIDDDLNSAPLQRLNSTKRIKKEIRNKRSSFLGIEGTDDDSYLDPELKLAPRPDITSFLQEESRVEKMFYKKSLYYDSDSNLGESRDSGVELDRGHSDDTWSNKQASPDTLSEQHSRQGSEPFTNTSVTSEEEELTKKERDLTDGCDSSEMQRFVKMNSMTERQEGIGQQLTTKLRKLEQEKMDLENQRGAEGEGSRSEEDNRIKSLEDQIREQQSNQIKQRCGDSYEEGRSEEVLRVERELLQLEQEELKRQRDSLMFRESQARRLSGRSLQDINMVQSFSTPVSQGPVYSYAPPTPAAVNYRQSMPDLAMKQVEQAVYANTSVLTNGAKNSAAIKKMPPPLLPMKPSRSAEMQEREINVRSSRTPSAEYSNIDVVSGVVLRQKSPSNSSNGQTNNIPHHQMSRHTLQALSAAPRSRLIPSADWLQPKRRSEPPQNYNYNQHWLIQEAEQRRIDQLRNNIKKQSQSSSSAAGGGVSRPKHLPDAVIQTLTQRVQNMSVAGGRPPPPCQQPPPPPTTEACPPSPDPASEKMLSVSGKKKCSHCGKELGRGAAMIIESLRLFYHLSCFQCCVCGVCLGDGRLGADVRVRHNQLHCHNCYSSDDGVKFSCV